MVETLGNLGDFIGGIAVVASLIYLAIQIRHNTASVRAASGQGIVESFRKTNRMLLDSEGLQDVFLRGLREYPDMEQPARVVFGAFMSDNLLHFQGVIALYDSGNLNEELYRAYLDFFAAYVATPGGARYWLEFGPACPPRMQQVVNERLDAGGTTDLLSMPFYGLE